MPCQVRIDQGRITLRPHLPQVRTPQAPVLALGSVGMVLARSWARSAVSALVAAVTGRQANPLWQRLRESDSEASAQRGAQPQALPVETCCAPLLGGIVSWWQGTPRAVAVAATTVAAPVAAGAEGAPARDRQRAGGPRAVCAGAVAAHCQTGLAAVLAPPPGWALLARRAAAPPGRANPGAWPVRCGPAGRQGIKTRGGS